MDKKDGKRGIEKLFNFRPVFFAAVFLCLGIVFCFFYYFYGVSALWLLLLIPLAATPFFFCRTRRMAFQTAWAVALFGVAFFVGFFSFLAQTQAYFSSEVTLEEHYVHARVVEIRSYEEQKGLVLDNLKFDGRRADGKLVAYLPTENAQNIEICDEVFFYDRIYNVSISGGNFSMMAGEFGDGVRYRAWLDEAAVVGESPDLFLSVRMRAEEVIDRGMDETTAAVTKGMLFGNTEEIDGELFDSIRRGGIAHIFAVSGLHVGSLFGFCLLLVGKTPLRNLPKLGRWIFLAVLLFFYAGLCGFSASVLRASIICLVGYASALLFVKTDFIESLGLALIFVLLNKPSALFEVGCQLSFAACFGIAFFARPIGQVFVELEKLYRKLVPKKLTRAEREALKNDDTPPPRISERLYRAASAFLAASFGAQAFTAPVLLGAFGYVSGWGMLLNCIFVPLTSALFSFLLLFVAVACLFPPEFAFVILYLPNALWSLALLLFQTFEFTSFAIEGLSVPFGGFLSYYAGCIFLTDKWNVKKSFSRILAIVCFVAFVVTMVAFNL